MPGKKIKRAYFHNDDGNCPNGANCQSKRYVIPSDELIVSRAYGKYVCSWYQPKKGDETVGWILASELEIFSPVKAPLLNKWLGEWESNGNTINIRRGQKPRTLKITGNAFWRGLGDNIHIGELDYTGIPKGYRLETGSGPDKYDCWVKMQMVGDFLIASDNMNCGGVNVSFSGVYRKKK
jgi:hypothetical protein